MASRLPRIWMKHVVDYYAMTFPLDAEGGQVATAPSNPTMVVRCSFQDAMSEVIETYKQRNEVAHASMFTIDGIFYAMVAVKDRVAFNGRNYRVIGKADLINLNRVYRIDLRSEVN